ncbi:MAG: hypothetical protein AAGB01_01120 [Cyanobacteria bacterium P01_F01_bin.42]
MVISPFLQKKLIDKRFQIRKDESVQSDLIRYTPTLIGALRVDAKARLPANRWVTYELQILDEGGNVLTAGLKQAWRDAGTWREGGESGSWDESDLNAGFALKSKEKESQAIRVVIQVLETGTSSNAAWNSPVTFSLVVHDGSIDIRYMWLGFFGTLAMAIITTVCAGQSGKKVIAKTIGDSDINARATLGGNASLIQVQIFVDADETTPSNFNINLAVRNPDGETIYQQRSAVPVKRILDNGVLDGGKASFCTYLLITPRDSYGFYVEVTPDQSVDRTVLTVTDNVKTNRAVEVTQIKDSR